MKRFAKYKLILAVLLFGLVMISQPAAAVKAESAAFGFSKVEETVRVGDVITVVLSVDSAVHTGELHGFISYNSNMLEYVTGPGCIVGGEGILRIDEDDFDENLSVRKYTMYFKVLGIGSSSIAMRGSPEIYESDTGYLMSVSMSPLEINAEAAYRASSDSRLAVLKVNPGKLDPEFDPETHEYHLTVPNETTSLIVSAKENHTGATVKIEGNASLNVGQNRVLILVTAEDGSNGKYVIYVVREAAKDTSAPDGNSGTQGDAGGNGDSTSAPDSGKSDDPSAEIGDSQGQKPANVSGDTYFYVSDEEEKAILNIGSRYIICSDASDVKIPSGYNKTSIKISGHKITAYVPSDDAASDFLLLVLSRDGAEPELYSFDRAEKTIQRFYSVRTGSASTTGSGYSTIEEQELVDGYKKSMSNMSLVIAILSGVSMLLLILTISMALKRRDGSDNDYRPRRSGGTRSSGTRSSTSAGRRSSTSGRSSGSRR